jgi:hypothetical protein
MPSECFAVGAALCYGIGVGLANQVADRIQRRVIRCGVVLAVVPDSATALVVKMAFDPAEQCDGSAVGYCLFQTHVKFLSSSRAVKK